MSSFTTQQILASEEFKALRKARLRLATPIVTIIIAAYFSFVLFIAFDKEALGVPFEGGTVSIGIYLGLGLLLLSFILAAVYMRVSQGTIATLQKNLQDKYK